MGTAPEEVKSTTPAPVTPDIWQSLRNEMDRLLDRFAGDGRLPSVAQFLGSLPAARSLSSFTLRLPAMDVTETPDAFKLTAELPGMTEKDIEVAVSDGTLKLKGEKKQEKEQKDKDVHMSERAYGMFERRFTLPDNVDADKIEAEFAKGVLTITLPKKPEAKADEKKIAVKPAA